MQTYPESDTKIEAFTAVYIPVTEKITFNQLLKKKTHFLWKKRYLYKLVVFFHIEDICKFFEYLRTYRTCGRQVWSMWAQQVTYHRGRKEWNKLHQLSYKKIQLSYSALQGHYNNIISIKVTPMYVSKLYKSYISSFTVVDIHSLT